MAAFVLTVSVGLQFVAAFWALGLARVTGRSPAWTFLAAAIGLMGVRRTITLTRLLMGDDVIPVDLAAETVALTISILMVLGIGALGPLVRRLQRTEEMLGLNEQLRQEADQRREAQESLEREQRTLRRLLQASDHERRLIAYDIHDGLAQHLAGALMYLQTLQAEFEAAPEESAEAFREGMALLRQAHSEARRLIGGVRPPVLDKSGIVAALTSMVQDLGPPQGPKIDFRSEVKFDRLPAVLENAVYRMAQEALHNACQHSRSERIALTLHQDNGKLSLEVRDWGVGFEPQAVPDDHFGLEGIRQRARLLGGELRIDSEPEKGTSVQITLPLVGK